MSAQPPLPNDTLPYRQQPIDYFGPETNSAVSRLIDRLAMKDVTLEFEERHGYLASVLKALGVPVESQMLVFAKNSVNARLISPEVPRALYFNDEVYVGYVPGAASLEISAVDPRKGAMFYTLAQKPSEPPKFIREENCLVCHASTNSLGIPGHLLKSFLTDSQGNPLRGYSRVTHETPFAKRWGGWYVTGDWGGTPHLGNLTTSAAAADYERQPESAGKRATFNTKFDWNRYPSKHSDLVALLVHDHQTHFHNLITRVRFESLLGRSENSEEVLLRALLFVDEPGLENPLLGSSGFETNFAKMEPRDKKGRSLRQFDLETRLFKYRCSYLIYSAAWEELPAAVKSRLYGRLHAILTGRDESPAFAKLPRDERQALLEILRETKHDLAEAWK